MGADCINFELRYREKNKVFDQEKRKKIEDFILNYAEE